MEEFRLRKLNPHEPVNASLNRFADIRPFNGKKTGNLIVAMPGSDHQRRHVLTLIFTFYLRSFVQQDANLLQCTIGFMCHLFRGHDNRCGGIIGQCVNVGSMFNQYIHYFGLDPPDHGVA